MRAIVARSFILTREVVMTVKVVALWGNPNESDKFEEEYGTIHLPLVAALPGL